MSMIPALVDAAIAAGAEILALYQHPISVSNKEDRSPVTEADVRAERLILAALARIAPDVPVVAEESVAAGNVPDIGAGHFFLVDPLDGTKEFISRNGEFTVNIALVEGGRPTLGVVHLPALGETYFSDGTRALRRRATDAEATVVRARTPADDGLVVVASRSHRDAKTDEFLASVKVKELISAGSSLKLCRIAEGAADLYPRLGHTMEWDIAAGQAVLEAAGGHVETLAGDALRYGKPGFENPHFVARGTSS